MSKIFNKKVLGYIALAMVCVLAGCAIGSTKPAAQADTVVLTSPFTEAIAKVQDSVVGVNNYQIVSNYGSSYGYGNSYGFPWDIFGFGYGDSYGYGNGNGNGNGNQQDSGREVKYGSGSGVVIAKEYVLTNYHVVDGAHSLKISVGDDTENLYDATLAAGDEAVDVAVLYVPGLPVEPVKLGDSDQLQVGDWVVNIGNAIGFTRTATAGIVSGLDREVARNKTEIDKYGRRTNVNNTMIQTDAAINNGNSGGGMFNTAGELVGIPTLKYSGTRSNGAVVESISMCIPINEAKPVIDEALNNKDIVKSEENVEQPAEQPEVETGKDRMGKPRLGVTVFTIQGDGTFPNGAYVTAISENGPAAKAGIKAGDIIVEINGTVVGNNEDLMNALEGSNAGDTVTIKVWRPSQVGNAEQGTISTVGEYVDGIQVTLEILENISDS